jgi:MFS family permease
MLLSLPLGRFLESQHNVVPWYSRARLLVFCAYLLTGLTPILIARELLPPTIILIWALVTIPQTVVTLAFTMMIATAVPPERRYWLLSWRWASMGAVMALAVVIVGWFLERVIFPLNYQVIFVTAFVCGIVSFYFSRQIEVPNNPPIDRGPRVPPSLAIRNTLNELRGRPEYVRFIVSSSIYYFGLMLALPIFPLFWIRELQASDFWIGAINTMSSGILLIGYFFWASISRKRGPAFILIVCGLGLGFYPLLTSLAQDVPPLLFYAALGGFCAAGIDLVQFDLLLKASPERRNATFIAFYRMAIYGATFIAPLLGTTLAEAFGLRSALVTATALRLGGVFLFWFWRVGR